MFDLIDLLEQHGLEVKRSSSNENEFRICCPFCVDMGTSPDFRFRLGFNIQSGLASCFNCGWRSRKAVIELVKAFGLGDEALGEVQTTHYTKQTRERPTPTKLPEGFQLLEEIKPNDELFGPARQYVNVRGITPEQLKRHEIGATVSDWRMRYRIIFPIRNPKGELLGYTGRDWTGTQEPKYLLSEGSKAIYNARPDRYPTKIIILSEGVTKSLAIERAMQNKLCSGAVFGKTVTDVQMEQLREFREVCLFSDPDKDGMDGFLGVASNLVTQFKRVSMAWPWPKKQADELSGEEILGYLRGRKPYSEMLRMQFQMERMER